MLLTFEFKTVKEAQEFLEGLIGGPKPAESVIPSLPATPVEPSQDSTAKLKRGRQAKIKAPAPEPLLAAGQTNVTKEAAFKALENLINTKGYDAGRDVLKILGVARFPELKPEQYASLVAACEQA